MQTFSQYAATRLLREHPARTLTFGGVAVKAGSIQTFAGVDLITGMPVLIYTLPERPGAIPEVYSEFIPAILETGFESELGYVVAASAPGYAALKPTLSRPRLEWLARSSARALADAHAGGLHHGNLEPAHFLVSGDHLMLEGWGLPWGESQPDYRAPEGGSSAAADVFAWARSLQALGRGNPRLMLEGELGRWIAHGLNARPQDRPTAQEMVMALDKLLGRGGAAPEAIAEPAKPPERHPVTVPVSMTGPGIAEASEPASPDPATPSPETRPSADRLENTTENLRALEAEIAQELPTPATPETQGTIEAPRTETERAAPETASLEPETEVPTPEPLGLETPPPETLVPAPRFETEPAVLHEPEHLAADEPDVKPKPLRESELDLDAPEPGARREAAPIRIGFDAEDDSWRQVVQPEGSLVARRPWIPALLAVLALGCLIGLFVLLRPTGAPQTTPVTAPVGATGSVVNFKLNPSTAAQGRLIVLEAPASAQLEPNSVLASVPGPVLFKTPGTYRLRVSVDGYKPGEFQLTVPGQNEIVLELRQR